LSFTVGVIEGIATATPGVAPSVVVGPPELRIVATDTLKRVARTTVMLSRTVGPAEGAWGIKLPGT